MSMSGLKILIIPYDHVCVTFLGQLSAAKEQFKSALYLCVDSEADRVIQGGFHEVSTAFNGKAKH